MGDSFKFIVKPVWGILLVENVVFSRSREHSLRDIDRDPEGGGGGNTAVNSQKAVNDYMRGKQLPPFRFAEHTTLALCRLTALFNLGASDLRF